MRKKKILLSLLYFFLSFTTIISVSIVFSYRQVRPNEICSAYEKAGSRVEFIYSDEKTDFKINEVKNQNIKESITSSNLSYTKIYSESYYSNENKPILIEDHPTKVLLTESSNNNYFNVELVRGNFPDDNNFIVTEEIAEYFGIKDAVLPVSITYDYVLNKQTLVSTISVSGIYKANNSKYINKPDCYLNDCSKYTIIGRNLDNMSHFAAFIDIVEFLRSDKISNAFVLTELMPRLGGIIQLYGYDSYSTYVENENFSIAVAEQRNGRVNSDLLIDLTLPFTIVGIVSFLGLIALTIILMRNYYDEVKFKFNTFHLAFLSLAISLLVILLVYSINIGGKILFIGTFFTGVTNIIAVNMIFLALLIVSICLTDGNRKRRNEKIIHRFESTDEGLISIIIPTYNGAKYLRFAIDSALSQSYTNIEVIVVNDGSTDNGETDMIVEPYIKEGKIQYFKKPNGGVSSALNFGISKAKGKYINWLSHDDLFTEDSVISRLSLYIDINNKHTIISSNTQYIDEFGHPVKRLAASTNDIDSISKLIKSTVNGCTLLMPREIFDNHKFKEGMIFMQDYFLWAELILDGYQFINLESKTVLNRVHKNQVTVKYPELREQDFKVFYASYIKKMFDDEQYIDLRRIMIDLEQRSKLHPFYKQYVEEIKSFLKEKKKYDLWDRIDIGISKLISSTVSLIRKISK